MKFTKKQTAAYGLGAIGKDMVYALSSSFVMYYYQDILGIDPAFVGFVLMLARVFDAINDPFMGVVVAKTRTKWGKFRPWILSGTVLNAFVLYALFAAPAGLKGSGLNLYFAIIYILWGMTYTMMDIPYWSLIPAVTKEPAEREAISVVGRTCAGVGNALITVFAMRSVQLIGGGITKANEYAGFKTVSLIVAAVFIVVEAILFFAIKEPANTKNEETKTASIKEMFQALFDNDQAMIVVITIVLINSALYITSNLLIYFFKYDVGGADWAKSHMLFNMVGGASQILSMMALYPILRRKMTNEAIFKLCLILEIIGYALILIACFTGLANNMLIICGSGLFVFLANGILTVLTTVFLSATVDYGELKTGKREESVIFSMQTFVVKLASGLAVFLCGLGLKLIGLVGDDSTDGGIVQQSAGTITGLRILMTVLPIIGLFVALYVFKKKFLLTDEKIVSMNTELNSRREG